MVLASSSPYFKARCWSGNVDGLIQYAHDPMSTDNKGKRKLAGSTIHGRLQLVEYVEEEEVPAVEAVLRHCYTEELCDIGGNAEELGVALLVQMMVLSNRWAE